MRHLFPRIAFFLTILAVWCFKLPATNGAIEDKCEGNAFCKKGVEGMCGGNILSLDYKITPRYNLAASSSDPTIGNGVGYLDYSRRVRLKFKVPLLNKESLKMALGFKYAHEVLQFNDDELEYALFQNINEDAFKTALAEWYVFKAFNEKHYLLTRAALSLAGNYNGAIRFNKDYQIWSGLAAFGIKLNHHVEIGAGVNYKNSFGFHSVYPIFFYNHTFNENWGLETVLPYRIRARYRQSDKTFIYAGIEGDAGNYHLKPGAISGPSADKALRMKYTEAKFHLRLQQAVKDPLWFAIETGYSKNFGLNFREIGDHQTKGNYVVSTEAFGGGWYVNGSLFLTIPKKLMEKKK